MKGVGFMKSVEELIDIFTKKPLKLIRSCEWLVLRPNDQIAFLGAEQVKIQRKATELMLDTPIYKDSELRKYYYDMKENEHKFNGFERWKVWGRN